MIEKNFPDYYIPINTVFKEKYKITGYLGAGGFGITYKGENIQIKMPVAIKEYYPSGYASRYAPAGLKVTLSGTDKNEYYKNGKEKFRKEAEMLGKCSKYHEIVSVIDFFEENETAYIVMEYVEGITLKQYVKNKGVFKAEDICKKMIPLLHALNQVHNQGLIHRDISPENIMLLSDGSLKLFDFGAARDYSDENKSLSILLKPGYAPEEQYRSRGVQGPFTDIYSVCATLYFCITGKRPDEAPQRIFRDEVKPLKSFVDLPERINNAIMKGLSVSAANRFQNVIELIEEISIDDWENSANSFDDEIKLVPIDDDEIEFIPTDEEESISDDKETVLVLDEEATVVSQKKEQGIKHKNKSLHFVLIGAVAGLAVVALTVFTLFHNDGNGIQTDTPTLETVTVTSVKFETVATKVTFKPVTTTKVTTTKPVTTTKATTTKPVTTTRVTTTKPITTKVTTTATSTKKAETTTSVITNQIKTKTTDSFEIGNISFSDSNPIYQTVSNKKEISYNSPVYVSYKLKKQNVDSNIKYITGKYSWEIIYPNGEIVKGASNGDTIYDGQMYYSYSICLIDEGGYGGKGTIKVIFYDKSGNVLASGNVKLI